MQNIFKELTKWLFAYIEDFFSFKGALSGLIQFLATESPLKMAKNAFYFTSKALFVLKILKFLSWLFGCVAKWLDKKNIKLMLNSNLMSQPG